MIFSSPPPREAAGQDAAIQEGVEFVPDEPGQLGAGAGLGVGDEAGRMLLHLAVQSGLLGAVAFVVGRGAMGSTLGLPRCSSHDGLPVG